MMVPSMVTDFVGVKVSFVESRYHSNGFRAERSLGYSNSSHALERQNCSSLPQLKVNHILLRLLLLPTPSTFLARNNTPYQVLSRHDQSKARCRWSIIMSKYWIPAIVALVLGTSWTPCSSWASLFHCRSLKTPHSSQVVDLFLQVPCPRLVSQEPIPHSPSRSISN